MRYIGIIILLILCLTLLLFTGCMINTDKPETPSWNLENQEDINQNSNNSQSSSTGSVEEPVIEEDTEEPGTVYPQQWATGDGTVENPWANDCIQKAYDFVPDGGTIFLKAGYYELSATVTLSKKVNIIGDGIDRTYIITANAHGFMVSSDYCSLRDFTIDGDAQTDNVAGTGCPIRTFKADYLLLENIKVKNAGKYMSIVSSYSTFRNIYAVDNYVHGLHPGACQHNVYENIYCSDNGSNGFDVNGDDNSSNNVYDNINCWNNGNMGIAIFNEKDGKLINSVAENNGGRGIYVSHGFDFTMDNCFIHSNASHGIYLVGSDNINISNVISKNNNTSNVGNVSGIYVHNVPSIKLSSCQIYDDRDSPLQDYAIITEGTTKYVEITNCRLIPNEKYAILNHANAIILSREKK